MARLHFRQWRQVLSFFIGLGIALGLGVATPTLASFLPLAQLFSPGVQYAQSSHSVSQEVKLGQEIDQQLRQQYQFVSDPSSNAYVDQVGQSVAHVSDCPQFPFRYSIVEVQQLNAFATTGGFVYVNSGLLKAVGSKAELAGVLGHESGHICHNDLIRKMRRVALERGIASLAGLEHNAFVNLATQVAVDLPNSRQVEYNADTAGQTYLERAGYNHYGLVDFLKKLLNMSSRPTILSTHPATKERIAVLEQRIAAGE